jgi:hypothetical protein
MSTRILAVAAAILAALVVQQYNQIGQLKQDVLQTQKLGAQEARIELIAGMEGQGQEIQRATTWLNEYYKAADGLQRPEGLWIDGHPDFEGISVWIFGVYLPHRLKGDNEEQARSAVVDAIKQSEEWRAKHHG